MPGLSQIEKGIFMKLFNTIYQISIKYKHFNCFEILDLM